MDNLEIKTITSNRATDTKSYAKNIAKNVILKPVNGVKKKIEEVVEHTSVNTALLVGGASIVIDGGILATVACTGTVTIATTVGLAQGVAQGIYGGVKGIQNLHEKETEPDEVKNAKEIVKNSKNETGGYNTETREFSEAIDTIIAHVNTKLEPLIDDKKNAQKRIRYLQHNQDFTAHNEPVIKILPNVTEKALYDFKKNAADKKIERLCKPMEKLEKHEIVSRDNTGKYIKL